MEKVDPNDGMVKSDRTLLTVIHLLHEMDEVGVTQLADELEMAKGTVHKHLKTLEQLNYVVNSDGQYRLGFKFFTYGVEVKQRYELCQLLENKVDELVAETGEMIVASVEEHGKGTIIGIRNDRYNLDRVSALGRRFHLHSCASGKAMLAQFSEEEIDRVVDHHGLPRMSDNTITTRENLLEAVDRVREQNYALNNEERRERMSAMAMAVRHPESGTIGALGISIPAHRMVKEDVKSKYEDALFEAVSELEIQLNYE